jgi:hypothetical protein
MNIGREVEMRRTRTRSKTGLLEWRACAGAEAISASADDVVVNVV